MRHYLLLLLLLVASIASGQSAAQYDKAPEFPGGNPAIETYLTKNLVYPEKARKKNIEGKVLVGFMVNEKGRVVNVSVLKRSPSFRQPGSSCRKGHAKVETSH